MFINILRTVIEDQARPPEMCNRPQMRKWKHCGILSGTIYVGNEKNNYYD